MRGRGYKCLLDTFLEVWEGAMWVVPILKKEGWWAIFSPVENTTYIRTEI